MNDASVKMAEFYQELIMQRSGEERLEMGCSMFDTAKEIIKSSIRNQNPTITLTELRKAVFIRFYGQEFDKDYLQKVCQNLT